ncbi:hypothetical protein [Litoribacter populi]|uniref:hypothetical protein n=1 Tax=Litoribacter populi TaxID=2598460 RepID=UPI00117DE234|nr:hypothetical protein [Litoribacter populi]
MKTLKWTIIGAIPLLFLLAPVLLNNVEEIDMGMATNMGMFFLTYFMVIFTWESLQKSRQESYLESRPYLIADFEAEEDTLYFYVKNIGKTSALDVSISINPDLKLFDQFSFNSEVFREKINFFPPGKIIKTNVNTTYEFHEKNEIYTLYLTYMDPLKNKIEEEIHMNLKYRRNLLYQKRKKMDDVVKSLEKIVKVLNKN